jgi:hypothetical protein
MQIAAAVVVAWECSYSHVRDQVDAGAYLLP